MLSVLSVDITVAFACKLYRSRCLKVTVDINRKIEQVVVSMMFHYHWKWSLQSSIDRLWPYISDTDRFRGATGFPAAKFTTEVKPDGTTRRIGKIRMYGFPIVWEEDPIEWIRDREFSDVQRYRVGPLKELRVKVEVEPRSDGGTDVHYKVWVTPGNILGYPGIPIQIGILQRMRFERAFKQMDAYVRNNADQPFLAQVTPIGTSGQVRLRDIAAQLQQSGYDVTLINRLLDYIQNSPDHQLTRMRPYALADAWHADRYPVLELFLQATKLGLLTLSWDMICPQCRGAKETAETLHDVSHQNFCPSCNTHYEVDFASTVEVTFQVNQAIKEIERLEYCQGSPQNTPHVLLQQNIPAGESRTLKLLISPGRYRWRVVTLGEDVKRDILRNNRGLVDFNTHTKNTNGTVTISEDSIEVEPQQIGAGAVSLTIVNNSAKQHTILLEHTQWSDQATTAAELTSLQSFRDLFSSEILRPGESIGVERLVIMFTDLKGSTMMYTAVGDAPAFRRVMDHFDILKESVIRNHGALVKTIGDAIMAVFTNPVYAIDAALDILKSIEAYNRQHTDVQLVMKMGVHQGACIAVTLNERLDYFGSVVNIAARLEGQSRGGDVIVSNSVLTDPLIEDYLKSNPLCVETFTTTLKGFSDSFSLHRLTLHENAGESGKAELSAQAESATA